MDETSESKLERCANEVAGAVSAVFDLLTRIDEHVRRLWNDSAGHGIKPSTTDFAPLASILREQLLDHEVPTYGTGMIFAPGMLRDVELHLEWWQRIRRDKVQRLNLDLNPTSERFYDYTAMEWFKVPRNENRSTVVGPYVDLHGADTYILTFGSPVRIEDTFFGISGADVALADIERHLTVPLMKLTADSALVTIEGRVLASNTAQWTPGMLLPQPSNTTGRHTVPVPVDAVFWKVVTDTPSTWM